MPGPGVRGKTGPVLSLEGGVHEVLDEEPERILRRVAEHLRRGVVPQDDAPQRRLGHDDRVASAGEDLS